MGSDRPKIIGRIFGRNENSASAAKNEKSRCLVTFHFQAIFSRESKLLVDIVNFYACLFPLPINHAHQALYQLQLADATQENHIFLYTI
jgi:hypothetical protein